MRLEVDQKAGAPSLVVPDAAILRHNVNETGPARRFRGFALLAG
jgi:hypothetical protein